MTSSLKIPSNKHWTARPDALQEVQEAVSRILADGNFILGKEVEHFEREFSAFSGLQGFGVGSGTDAITMGLMAGGIGAGDEVLVPVFAPGGTITGVVSSGATPVLVEVTADFQMDLCSATEAITARTRAMVCVHMFGSMDNMVEISRMAEAFKLWVVEDCAHAHGAMLLDSRTATWRPAGSIGDTAAFSFYPTKNLGACGDAGFCASKHTELLPRLKALRQYGWTRKDHAERVGRNTRLDELQAGILRVGLRSLLARNQRRRSIATLYHKLLSPNMPKGSALPPENDPERLRVFHQYVIQSGDRDRLLAHLSEHGIGYGFHYPPLNMQPAFVPYARGLEFPVARKLASRVVSLPIFPELSNSEVESICETLNTFWRTPGEDVFLSASRFPS